MMKQDMSMRHYILFFCGFVMTLICFIWDNETIKAAGFFVFLLCGIWFSHKRDVSLFDHICATFALFISILANMSNGLGAVFFNPTLLLLLAGSTLALDFHSCEKPLHYKRNKPYALIIIPIVFILCGNGLLTNLPYELRNFDYVALYIIALTMAMSFFSLRAIDKVFEKRYKEDWALNYEEALKEYYGTEKDPE